MMLSNPAGLNSSGELTGIIINMDKWNANDYSRNSSAQESWAKELISKLSLKGHESLIDIGCGDGKITNEIAARLPAGLAVGIDSSGSMIELASSTYARDNLSFVLMDAENIHLDRKFDVAFSNATLHWVKDHQAVLASLKKHMNPNGKILFQMGGKGNAQDIVNTLDRITADERWSEFFKQFEFPYHFCEVEDYEAWLPASGYRAVRIELITKDMVHKNTEGLKGWLRTTWFPYINKIPIDLRESFLDELVNTFLEEIPLDPLKQTHVKMVRLEVEAYVL
jgi:trans-aconitate methyltransferase